MVAHNTKQSGRAKFQIREIYLLIINEKAWIFTIFGIVFKYISTCLHGLNAAWLNGSKQAFGRRLFSPFGGSMSVCLS
jgi:hypothetical protein